MWRGPSETAMTFVDLVPGNKAKNAVVLKCTHKCVVEHIFENQVVLTKHHFVSISFPLNTQPFGEAAFVFLLHTTRSVSLDARLRTTCTASMLWEAFDALLRSPHLTCDKWFHGEARGALGGPQHLEVQFCPIST